MFGIDIFQALSSQLRGWKQNGRKNKKFRCPQCGAGSDDPQEVFHHITVVHVLKEMPVEVDIVWDGGELEKVYADLVSQYRTSDRIMAAIADLRDVPVSEKVLLGYVLGRNVSMQDNAGRETRVYLTPVFPSK